MNVGISHGLKVTETGNVLEIIIILLLLLLLLPKHLYSAPRRTERFTKEKERKIETKNYGNK